METESSVFSDNQDWSGVAEAEFGASKEQEKSRRRSKRKGRNRRRAEAGAGGGAERHERRIELPFTIWDRTNPDVLNDPNPHQPAESESMPSAEKSMKQASIEKPSPDRQVATADNQSEPMAIDKAKTEAEKPVVGAEPAQKASESTHAPDGEAKVTEAAAVAAETPNAGQEQSNSAQATQSTEANPRSEPVPSVREGSEANDAAKSEEAKEPAAEIAPTERLAVSKVEEVESDAVREARLQVGQQLAEMARQTAARAAELAANNHAAEQVEPTTAAPESTPSVAERSAETQTSAEATREVPAIHEQGGMAREDLLALANSIQIEGVSVSEMFRAKRIDEAGLRRIVSAFLRGEDIRKLVANEVVRYQMRFERDPALRDANIYGAKSRSGAIRTMHIVSRTKTVLDPERMKRGADRLTNRLLNEFDRAREAASGHPSGAKTAAISAAVVAYFIILFVIIRA